MEAKPKFRSRSLTIRTVSEPVMTHDYLFRSRTDEADAGKENVGYDYSPIKDETLVRKFNELN